MSVLFYKRPSYVDRPVGPINESDCQKYIERLKNNKGNIPDDLSFENVMDGKTLPPCSVQDFMDYLVYIAHDAENLQFYLWLEDYTQRFEALKKPEQALSPEWKPAVVPQEENTAPEIKAKKLKKKSSSSLRMSEIKGPGIDLATDNDYQSFISNSVNSSKTVSEAAEDAVAQAGLRWQPFTVQPFREEIGKVIAHYFAPGAPRELNLSHRDRTALLHALQHTTHPSAFAQCGKMVEATLRGQLHPNFIRWSICNGNKPKVFFVRVIGVSHIFLGVLIALLLTLSRASRWYRVLSAIVTFIGISTMVAAYKGLCVILHASGKVRNVKPWEDLDDSPFSDTQTSLTKPFRADDEEATLAHSDTQSYTRSYAEKTHSLKRPRSFDTFGTGNTFDNESWVEKYKQKPVMKKVFENNTWVQDAGVRTIQDTIVRQSQIWGVILTFVITAFFVALPKGNFY